MNQQLRIY